MQKTPVRLHSKTIAAIIIVTAFASLFTFLMAYLAKVAAARRTAAKHAAITAAEALAAKEAAVNNANAHIDAAKAGTEDKFTNSLYQNKLH